MDSNRSASRELVVNTIVFGIGTVGSKIIMFILLPIYTGYMTTSELGVAELVVNYMNLLYPIASANIVVALLRYSMESQQDKKKILQNAMLVVCVGVFLTNVVVSLIHTQSAVKDWRLYLSLMLFVYSVQQMLSMFAKALDKTKICAIGNVIYTVALLVFSSVFLIVFKMGTSGYLLGMILANVVSVIYYCIFIKIRQYVRFTRMDKKLLAEMLTFSTPLILGAVSGWITTFCDRFVLEYFWGTDSVGIYSVASKLPSLISAFSSVFMSAWLLSAIKEYEAGKDRAFSNMVFRKFNAFFMAWAALMIFCCRWVMMLLAKGEFSEGWKYAPLLLCSALFGGLGNFFGTFYTSAKRNISLTVTTLIGAAVNFGLNFVLIPYMGIQGATFTTMISQFIVFICRMLYARKFVIIEIDYVKMFISIVAIVAESFFVAKDGNMLIAFALMLTVCLIYAGEWKKTFHAVFARLEKH